MLHSVEHIANRWKQKNEKKYSLGRVTGHNGVAASFFPAHLSSIQFARDVKFSIFAEAERLV